MGRGMGFVINPDPGDEDDEASYELNTWISSLPSPVIVQANLIFQEQNQGSLNLLLIYNEPKSLISMDINWEGELWVYVPMCTL